MHEMKEVKKKESGIKLQRLKKEKELTIMEMKLEGKKQEEE